VRDDDDDDDDVNIADKVTVQYISRNEEIALNLIVYLLLITTIL
jgi:hypothetical protein